MKKRLPPLCLLIALSFAALAQSTTPNGWSYETLRAGQGDYLSAQDGILTHNQLADAEGNILVSTLRIGVPDYQLMSELSPAFQQAFSVMQAGGKYRFTIPLADFKEAMRSNKPFDLPGDEVVWEMEVLKVLPPLPDAARVVAQTLKTKGTTAAFDHFQRIVKDGSAYLGEWEVNQIGYFFLNQDRLKEAITVLQYNTKQHPASANAFDSLAEAYYKNGQLDEAKSCYQRSLKLNPQNENARKMLSKLK